MRHRAFLKPLFLFAVLSVLAGTAWAQDSEKNNPLAVNLGIDFGWDPECYRKTETAHFSGFKDGYEYLEARARLNAEYTVNTPLGEHFLLKGANVKLCPTFEITPISVRGLFKVDVTPVPFLVFSAGGSAGTAWHIGEGLGGMRKLNVAEAKYEDVSMTESFYYDYWVKGVFQFDTGAIWSGDWTHVLFQASYECSYKEVTGFKDHTIGKWMGTELFTNGWQYESVITLAYQIPSRVYRAGIFADIWGHYNSDDYGIYGDTFKGDFMYVSICPFVQTHITKKDDISFMAEISSRRAFYEQHSKYIQEPVLHYKGYEWYFMRLVCQYAHYF